MCSIVEVGNDEDKNFPGSSLLRSQKLFRRLPNRCAPTFAQRSRTKTNEELPRVNHVGNGRKVRRVWNLFVLRDECLLNYPIIERMKDKMFLLPRLEYNKSEFSSQFKFLKIFLKWLIAFRASKKSIKDSIFSKNWKKISRSRVLVSYFGPSCVTLMIFSA